MSANYTPQTWTDGSTSTPLSAARMGVIEAGIAAVDTAAKKLAPSADKTADYTVTTSDVGTTIVVNSATAKNVTVNTSVLAAGQVFEVWQRGAGQVTMVAGAGMTQRAPAGAKTRVQYSIIRVWAFSATEYVIGGDATV